MPNLIHSSCFVVTYWVVAPVGSALNTIFAPTIHNFRKTIGKQCDGLEIHQAIGWSAIPWASRISQWVLNFLGSMVGWVALAYILFFRVSSPMNLEFTDLVALAVAFYGITGYLPYILIQKGLPWK